VVLPCCEIFESTIFVHLGLGDFYWFTNIGASGGCLREDRGWRGRGERGEGRGERREGGRGGEERREEWGPSDSIHLI
jgi:hypothetical protein